MAWPRVCSCPMLVPRAARRTLGAGFQHESRLVGFVCWKNPKCRLCFQARGAGARKDLAERLVAMGTGWRSSHLLDTDPHIRSTQPELWSWFFFFLNAFLLSF